MSQVSNSKESTHPTAKPLSEVENAQPPIIGAPQGWTTAAPRDELRPKFAYDAKGGRDGKGAFVIEADRREGLDGWWTATVPVKGGSYHRFHAVRKIERLMNPRQNAVVRILWQDANRQQASLDTPAVSGYLKGWTPRAEAEFSSDRPADAAGWTEVSDTYLVPAKATQAAIELHLQWPRYDCRICNRRLSLCERSPIRSAGAAPVHWRSTT